jgi:restriction system protein
VPKRDGLPKYDDFMKPVLEALNDLGGSGSNDEINEAIIAKLNLDQALLDTVYESSGAPILPDRMSWARSYLKLADLVTNPNRGVWVLTENGRAAVEWPESKLRKAVSDAFNAHEAKRKATRAEAQALGSAPDEDIGLLGLETDWRGVLLQNLLALDPSAFERLAQRLLRESGFIKVEVTGQTGDGGIDGVGVLRVNLISFQVLFQCKRWKGSVGASTVRDFRGAMQGRADKGLIITTGSFTNDARKEATRDGAPAIDLIDGEALCDLLKGLRLGVKIEQVVREDVTVDEPFFAAI